MNWIKSIVNLIKYLFYLCFVSFIIIEIVFRILPVSDSYKVQPINKKNPNYHFAKNREVTKQIGFNFKHVNSKKINNYGFFSDEDYLKNDSRKQNLVAVIGDSYVQASQVKNSDAFPSILNQIIENFTVYSFGAGGAPLSQYLAWSDYVNNEFNPDIFVFLIIANDFDQSWYSVKGAPGFHYFKENGDLHLVDYTPSIAKKMLRQSAFIRYLYIDLKIDHQVKRFKKHTNNLEQKQIKSKLENEKLGMRAIDLFFKKINNLANTKKVILMVDGDRSSIYNGKIKRDKDVLANRWFEKVLSLGQAQENKNLHLLDLQTVFVKDWKKNQKKFNYEYDSHWNERGHSIAGKALADILKKITN